MLGKATKRRVGKIDRRVEKENPKHETIETTTEKIVSCQQKASTKA